MSNAIYTTNPVLPIGTKVVTPAGPGTIVRVGTVWDGTTPIPMLTVATATNGNVSYRGNETYMVEVA